MRENMFGLIKKRADALTAARAIIQKYAGSDRVMSTQDQADLERLHIEGRTVEMQIEKLCEGTRSETNFVPLGYSAEKWATMSTEAATKDTPGRAPYIGPLVPGGGVNRSAWTDVNGRVLACAGAGQSFSEACREAADRNGGGWRDVQGASYGRVIRALITGDKRGLNDIEIGALSEGVNSAGGYLVPDAFSANIIDKARAAASVFQAGAQTIGMTTESLRIARLQTDPTFAIAAENASISEGEPVFGSVLLTARKLACYFTASRELAEDAPNFASAIDSMLSQSLAATLDEQCLMGAGGSEFTGLYTATMINSESSIGAPAWQDLEGAYQTLLENNTPSEGLSYILCPRDNKTLSVLQASTAGTWLGPPPNVATMRKYVTTSIPKTLGAGANESVIFAGYFPDMLIGIRTSPMLEFTTDGGDTFRKHQVGIKMTWRGDIALTRPGSFIRMTGTTA